LTEHQKEVLEQYYVDYKAMKGNSYIDKYYNRMKKWKVVEDDYDDDDAL
jgi:superoxide dismutase